MVASMEVLDALKGIKLNLYERKIFVALLAKGVATAAELSEIASVPRSRSYDVLESLAEKGFVIVQPSKPIKYVALPPKESLERTKETLRTQHEEMIERITKLQNSPVIQELESIYKGGLNLVQPTELTGTLKGKHIIDRQLKSILRGAQKQISIVTTEAGLEELHTKHFRTLRKIAKNGIKLRIAAPLKNKAVAKALAEVAEVRHTKGSFGRMFVIDNQHLVLGLTDDTQVHDTQDVALWTNSEHVVERMATPFFNYVWNGAK